MGFEFSTEGLTRGTMTYSWGYLLMILVWLAATLTVIYACVRALVERGKDQSDPGNE